MNLTWENLLKYLRWQCHRPVNDTAYVYADFDGLSIGLDGHLDKEGLEEFLALEERHDDQCKSG